MQSDSTTRPDLPEMDSLAREALEALEHEQAGDHDAIARFSAAARERRTAPRMIQMVLAAARQRFAEAQDAVARAAPERSAGAEDADPGADRRPAPKLGEPAYRGLLGVIVRALAPYTEASLVAILLQLLIAVGSAVGRTAHVRVGETFHYANEFLLIVGRSSKSRKGDSKGAALRVPSGADPVWATRVLSGLSTGEGLIHHVRDAVKRPNSKGEMVLADAGEEDKRLLAVESEFASVLKVMGREGNPLSAVLRNAWDGPKILALLTKTNPTKATSAHISVIGHATPADLHKYLTDTETANGFANRFLIVEVERAKKLPSPGTVDSRVIDDLVERMRHVLDQARRQGELRRTSRADELWCTIYGELSAERPGMVGDLLARAEAHVLRLSLIYALADGAEAIDVPHLESALAVWDVVEESVASIFARRTGNADADRIAEAFGPGDRMSRSEMRAKLFSGHLTAARLDAAIGLLASLPGWRLSREKTAGRDADVLERVAGEIS